MLFYYFRRKYEEKVSDMKQEKIYLEYKVDTLEAELKEWKDGTYQQRIRALDLKQDLREVGVLGWESNFKECVFYQISIKIVRRAKLLSQLFIASWLSEWHIFMTFCKIKI